MKRRFATNRSKFVEQIARRIISTAARTEACVIIFYSHEKKKKLDWLDHNRTLLYRHLQKRTIKSLLNKAKKYLKHKKRIRVSSDTHSDEPSVE